MILVDSDRDTLLAALQSVAGVAARRPATPVLTNVLLRRTGGAVELCCTDLEREVTTTAVLAGDAGDHATTVNAIKLLEVLRALPARQALRLTAATGRLTLRSGGSRITLQTLPAEDFPRMLPTPQGALELTLARAGLARLIDQVAFAMATQDIRYFFNGLLFSVADGRLTVVGTDGNRLAVSHLPVADGDVKRAAILPRKSVLEVQRLLKAGQAETVSLHLSETQVRCRIDGVELASHVIEGQFPDYRRVLPVGNPLGLSLDRAALLASLQRAVILSNEKFRGIRLQISRGSLRLLANNAEQEESCEDLAADYEGDALEVGLNATYLIDLLASTDAPRVHMALRDPHSSVLFTLPEHPGFAYVVGPMRI